MKRAVIPEWFDNETGSPAEIAATLRDLSRINRWFGGVSTMEALVRRAAEQAGRRELSLLDVAAGDGNVPRVVKQKLERGGLSLDLTLLDRDRAHLNGAANAVIGDALAMPFRENEFDIVTCSLFLHHLEPPQVIAFVNEALRVARIAVAIHDLRRSRLHLAAVYAGLPLFRSRITWHDAPASVRRSYTIPELRDILKETCDGRLEIASRYFFRMGAIIWKMGPAP
jgi:hypothetical protein